MAMWHHERALFVTQNLELKSFHIFKLIEFSLNRFSRQAERSAVDRRQVHEGLLRFRWPRRLRRMHHCDPGKSFAKGSNPARIKESVVNFNSMCVGFEPLNGKIKARTKR
jgi:hypothetical protein